MILERFLHLMLIWRSCGATLPLVFSFAQASDTRRRTPSHQQARNDGFDDGPDRRPSAARDATRDVPSGTNGYLQPFSLQLTEFEESLGGRGVQTTVDRNEGDVLLKIPLQDTITVPRLLQHIAPAGTSRSGRPDDEGRESAPATDDQEELLALGLLWLRDVKKDPYVVNVLPTSLRAVWTMPAQLWESISPCLPRCYLESFLATRNRVRKFASEVSETHEEYSHDDALWAFSMVRSRSVAVPELEPSNQEGRGGGGTTPTSSVPLALVPGLDLFNHAFGAGTKLQLAREEDELGGTKHDFWLVTSSESFTAGEQVFLSYGDEKDNWKLLLTYGFTVPENPNSIVFWSWHELLDAAKVVRPAVFSDRVCNQLLNHPQLGAYTLASEGRATFSFDAKRGEARESLSNGLAMLASLATQLGHPGDASLASDALGQLIATREQDLAVCQNRLKEVRVQLEKEDLDWIPFVDSLRVALEQEALDLTKKRTEVATE
jgi:hypothetical protein